MTWKIQYNPTDLTSDSSHDALISGWLPEESDEIAEIASVCREHGLEATLYDRGGFIRGWVHADGDWRLQ